MKNYFLCLVLAATGSLYSGALADVPKSENLPECGHMYAPPFGHRSDAYARTCAAPQDRNYTPISEGFGRKALDLESEACFVPDVSYELLDNIVSEVRRRIPDQKKDLPEAEIRRLMELVSKVTGDVLVEEGFQLYIPTDTLGDGLHFRQSEGEPPRHIIDCDTSSLILLEVADALDLPASLVDITLQSGSGHNYVRWHVSETVYFDWDTNGRGVCQTPSELPEHEGVAMGNDETMSYLYLLRTFSHETTQNYALAIEDYKTSLDLNPNNATAQNNLSWMISTKEFPDRRK